MIFKPLILESNYSPNSIVIQTIYYSTNRICPSQTIDQTIPTKISYYSEFVMYGYLWDQNRQLSIIKKTDERDLLVLWAQLMYYIGMTYLIFGIRLHVAQRTMPVAVACFYSMSLNLSAPLSPALYLLEKEIKKE